MGFWDDITGVTAQRNAARGLERYNNNQADIYANRTQNQFGNLASQYEALRGTQQLDGLGNVDAFLNPYLNYVQGQAANSVLNTYANDGKVHSGSAKNTLLNANQGVAANAWQQALNNYMAQTQANNQMAMQGNAQNFNNAFQANNMINQADATRFNTATGGRANVASIQAPSAWDTMLGLGSLAIGGANAAANVKNAWKPVPDKPVV